MQDFFTELDSDLGEKRNITPPSKHVPPPSKPKHIPSHKAGSTPKHTSSPSRKEAVMGHILEIRSQMMKAGVVVVVFRADEKTRMLLGHLKLETRGFAHLDEVRELHKAIIKKARASYEDTVKDIPDIEEKDLLKIIRRDLESFLVHKIDRTPVIIPMILSI